jgi:NAD(P)-dependent dehydrogenase (short-subunit alcohol dehydrogenase family)
MGKRHSYPGPLSSQPDYRTLTMNRTRRMNPFSLEDKNIIVTGASSGIGRQCAVQCSQAGARIILAGRDEGRLNETLGLMDGGREHIPVLFDLLDHTQAERAVKKAAAEAGPVDGVVHCAGISATLPFHMTTPGKLEHYFRINVGGALLLSQLVVKRSVFSGQGGSVVFISSVMGSAGESGKSLYSMTKGALLAASRSLAVEFAPRRIRFNCISPGVVRTPMSESALYSKDEESLSRIRSLHPLGLGHPEDVAGACIYLLSDAAKWVTGINLVVDGGYLAR